MLDQVLQLLPDKFEYSHFLLAGYRMDIIGKLRDHFWELIELGHVNDDGHIGNFHWKSSHQLFSFACHGCLKG